MLRIRAWLARLVLLSLLALAELSQPAPAAAAEWVQNFVQTELWSGPDGGAVSFGTAPQWDYFEVVAPQTSGRFHVLVARSGNYAFVDARAVGPSGPPPVGWPGPAPAAALATAQPAAPLPGPPTQASLGPSLAYDISADRGLWPALLLLQNIQHTWTLQALASTGTRLDWALMPPDAAGMYQPTRGLVTFNVRWQRSDPRALAAIVEHEAKHVADMLAGLDVASAEGCIVTEVNAFREEAKTWGELVGPRGKLDPQDDLERSLNQKLALYLKDPDGILDLIIRNPGYRSQCRIR